MKNTIEQENFLRQLFVAKVLLIIGVDKTFELLKECNDVMQAHFKINDSESIEKDSIKFTEKKLKYENIILGQDYKIGIEKYLTKNVTSKENVLIGSFTKIESGTKIGNNVIIHDEVIIGKNCTIYDNVVINDNCVLADNTVIKENTILNKSVNIYKKNITIGSNCKIGVQSEICYNIEDNTVIKPFTMQKIN